MKVILVDNVKNVGKKNDVVDVKGGFALNFLLPRGLARHATSATIKDAEAQKDQLQAQAAAHSEALESALKSFKGTVEIAASANEKGHLFLVKI